jgi:hypothetical protein
VSVSRALYTQSDVVAQFMPCELFGWPRPDRDLPAEVFEYALALFVLVPLKILVPFNLPVRLDQFTTGSRKPLQKIDIELIVSVQFVYNAEHSYNRTIFLKNLYS